jgi:D-serine dehydratase
MERPTSGDMDGGMLDPDPQIDGRTKGLPPGCGDLRLSQIGAQAWSLLGEDLPLPAAVLREDALANNSEWMREFVRRTGAQLAPHGKTTLSPQLFARQIADGAWGITLSTAQHVKVARMAGVRRILLANEPVGPVEIAYLLDELRADPGLELLCLADSTAGVRRLADAAAARPVGRPLGVLLEVGYPGGRAGCRSLDEARAVAQAVRAAAPYLALRGVEGFEGLHQHLPAADGAAKVAGFLRALVEVAERLDAEGLLADGPPILSAGGSAFYDMVMQAFSQARLSRPPQIILRSGCYLTHDAGLYERSFRGVRERSATARDIQGRFQNALEVWAYVLSVPEPRRAILGAGRRDFGHDAAMPTLLRVFRPGRDRAPRSAPVGWDVAAVNDQHAHVTLPETADIAVGDMVALGVSHPCTTFDKWRLILVVDEAYGVTSAVQTFF